VTDPAVNRTRRNWLIAGCALAAAAAGFALRRLGEKGAASAKGVDALLALRVADPDGKLQSMTQWRGKILVVNFWATWCQPCREEIPALLRIAKKHASKNLQIVGIAVDSADKVKEFAAEFKIDYALMIGGLDSIELTRQLGNLASGLPFTAVLDRDGRLVKTQLGQIAEQDLESLLAPLLSPASGKT
jgi:thiol-disulfide isomerase/thioredoxin